MTSFGSSASVKGRRRSRGRAAPSDRRRASSASRGCGAGRSRPCCGAKPRRCRGGTTTQGRPGTPRPGRACSSRTERRLQRRNGPGSRPTPADPPRSQPPRWGRAQGEQGLRSCGRRARPGGVAGPRAERKCRCGVARHRSVAGSHRQDNLWRTGLSLGVALKSERPTSSAIRDRHRGARSSSRSGRFSDACMRWKDAGRAACIPAERASPRRPKERRRRPLLFRSFIARMDQMAITRTAAPTLSRLR